jgi:Tfp pilus assembly protein PilN
MNRLLAVPASAAAIELIVLLGVTVQDAAANLETTKITLDSNKVLLAKRQAQKKELSNSLAAMEIKVAASEAARKNYAAALDKLTTVGTKMNADLNASVDKVVPGLDIKNLALTQGRLNITGHASSEQEVMEYIRQLTYTGRFAEITISNLTRVEDVSENDTTGMDYTLSLRIKG